MKLQFHPSSRLYSIEVENEDQWLNLDWRTAILLLKSFPLTHANAARLLKSAKQLSIATGLTMYVARSADEVPAQLAFVRRKPE
jgi:hypothetical protein